VTGLFSQGARTLRARLGKSKHTKSHRATSLETMNIARPQRLLRARLSPTTGCPTSVPRTQARPQRGEGSNSRHSSIEPPNASCITTTLPTLHLPRIISQAPSIDHLFICETYQPTNKILVIECVLTAKTRLLFVYSFEHHRHYDDPAESCFSTASMLAAQPDQTYTLPSLTPVLSPHTHVIKTQTFPLGRHRARYKHNRLATRMT
jgi:hypothetical protein